RLAVISTTCSSGAAQLVAARTAAAATTAAAAPATSEGTSRMLMVGSSSQAIDFSTMLTVALGAWVSIVRKPSPRNGAAGSQATGGVRLGWEPGAGCGKISDFAA